MENPKYGQSSMSKKEFLSGVKRIGDVEEIESFFEKEKSLLNHLYKLEKREAQQTAKEIIYHVPNSFEDDRYISIKYYFITLSSIVARYLEQKFLTSSRAFSFNATCIRLVEKKLTKDNAEDVSDELIELFTYVLAEKKLPSLQHNTVNNVILYIDEEVEAPLTVEGIANKFELSTSHLSRIFHENAGVTLVEYINMRKVEEAQYYLRFSEKKISEISDQFHFCNQSYFTRIFKKYNGETPRRFRHDISGGYFQFTLPEKESAPEGGE